MIELLKLGILVWIGFLFTVFATLMFAHLVSERRLQAMKRDEFLWLMEHHGFPDEDTAVWCLERVQNGDYNGAVTAMRRKLRDEDFG